MSGPTTREERRTEILGIVAELDAMLSRWHPDMTDGERGRLESARNRLAGAATYDEPTDYARAGAR